MKIRFYADPATAHIYNHDVDEDEIEEIFADLAEDRPGREDSRIAIGRTAEGRILRVIYVRDPKPDTMFVITAYELQGKPLVAFKRRMRKKHK